MTKPKFRRTQYGSTYLVLNKGVLNIPWLLDTVLKNWCKYLGFSSFVGPVVTHTGEVRVYVKGFTKIQSTK